MLPFFFCYLKFTRFKHFNYYELWEGGKETKQNLLLENLKQKTFVALMKAKNCLEIVIAVHMLERIENRQKKNRRKTAEVCRHPFSHQRREC